MRAKEGSWVSLLATCLPACTSAPCARSLSVFSSAHQSPFSIDLATGYLQFKVNFKQCATGYLSRSLLSFAAGGTGTEEGKIGPGPFCGQWYCHYINPQC